jgi:DNA mismatch repair ATPase MutS
MFWPKAVGMILSQKLRARYRQVKQEVSDGLLLMPVGAFMQVMGDDARTVAQVMGLTW